MATKKSTGKRASAKRANEGEDEVPTSMPKAGKDPKGGLTAKGRAFFAKKEGSHLRPGVQGPADTPEKMVRKGSFLRRHFTHPRGPMKDDKGQPTRLALSAHAWGEPVPNTTADAKKLAAKGHQLLEQYHEVKSSEKTASRKKVGSTAAAKGVAATKGAIKRSAKSVPGTSTARKRAAASRSAAKKSAATKATVKKSAPGAPR